LAGRIDMLVNNAGIYPFGPTENTTEQDFDAVYDLNTKVPFFLVAALAPKMAERGHGLSTYRRWSRSSAWQAWRCTDRARLHWSC
jgi:NAD(P)-dependent dehydrogenase (short-subunit alcohol dehydrogenase family)